MAAVTIHEEHWVPKNWCFWTVVLEKTLESPLDCREIKPVHPQGNQPWMFIGRTDAETSILWPPDANTWLTGKDPDAGKDWRQKEKGTTEDEMVRRHHRFNGHESEQILDDSARQRSLACCRSWGTRVGHDLGTEQQNGLKVCYHTKEMFPLLDIHILPHMVMDIDSCSPITISETLGKVIELLWASVFSFIKCEI